ncbi:hypothetical protein DIPPA_07876 [Diplonema papillatum]|nr:hypothetical protein DIPPA_07876 [Diplonema papillatum]
MSDVALHRFGSRPFTLYDLRKRVSVDCHTCTQFADILVSRGDLQCVTMSSVTGLHWKAYVASSPHGKPPAPAPAAVEPSAADDSGDEKQGLLDSFDRSGSGLSVQTRRPTATSSRPIAAASSSRPACDLSINDE